MRELAPTVTCGSVLSREDRRSRGGRPERRRQARARGVPCGVGASARGSVAELSDFSSVVLVCPSFLFNGLLSWARTEELLLKFLGHD